MKLYIGVDLGTSAMKLMLMAADGTIHNVVTKEYPLEFPQPGWSQQAPEDWKNALLEGVPELLNGFIGSDVAGIGCGGQMHGLVVLDDEDRVIRPAILWNDGRTAPQVDYLNGVIGKDVLSANTANIAFAGFTAPKILWMRENEPELFDRIAKMDRMPFDEWETKVRRAFLSASDEVVDLEKKSGKNSVDLSGRYPNRETFIPGKWETLEEGSDCTLLAVGSMVETAIAVHDMLAKRGIRARLVNASTVKPLDEKLLREIADKPVFTLEEHVRTGGFGAAVCDFLTENGFAAPAKVFALPDAFVTHGSRNLLLDEHGLSPEKIADEIVNTLQKK